ncbi:MAG: hypothetical protein JWL77_7137 [Chthonomonadaceae bacterium]|nr:hypothetical protein [Chthonomonadaceae bacterium]
MSDPAAGRKSSLVEKVLQLTGAPVGREDVTRRNLSRKSTEDLEVLYARLAGASERGAARLKPTAASRVAHAEATALREHAFARLREISQQVREGAAEAVVPRSARVQGSVAFGHVRFPATSAPEPEPAWAHKELTDVMESLLLVWMTHSDGDHWSSQIPRLVALDPIKTHFDNYCRVALDSMGRSAVRLLRNELVHGVGVRKSSFTRDLLKTINADPIVANPALEPVFLGKNDGKLNPARAVEALAMIQHYAVGYDADVIVCLDSGSEIVGRFLVSQLGAKVGRPPAMLTGSMQPSLPVERILLVADVVREADAILQRKHSLQRASKGAEVRVAALAGSSAASEMLGDVHEAYFTHVTLVGTAELPWDGAGGYRSTKARHLFGAGSDTELPIEKAFFDRVSRELE